MSGGSGPFRAVRGRRAAVAALAGVIVAGGVVGVLLVRGGDASPSARAARPTCSSAPLSLPRATVPPPAISPTDPHRASTQTLVDGWIAHAATLPGAVRRSAPPLRVLGNPQYEPGGGDTEIHRTVWWVAPGTRDAALAFYATQLSPGLRPSGAGTTSTIVRTLMYEGDTTDAVRSAMAYLDVSPAAHGVAIRLDVYAMWQPTRPRGSFVVDPTSVRASVAVTGPRGLQRRTCTLDAARARDLAAAINRLPAPVDFAHSCAQRIFAVEDDLLFTTPAGPVAVTLPDNCLNAGTIVTADGHAYGLAPDGAHDTVLDAMGLPASFGFAR